MNNVLAVYVADIQIDNQVRILGLHTWEVQSTLIFINLLGSWNSCSQNNPDQSKGKVSFYQVKGFQINKVCIDEGVV